MQYRCSRCHYKLTAPRGKDGDGGELQCPRCKAEAGLEPLKGTPRPMILFAVFLLGALVASAVGGVLTLTSGAG